MARGWESKAVEDQQDAAAARRSESTSLGSAAPTQERAGLMLARTRALADLQLACSPHYRAMLERAISDLDRQLSDLEAGHNKAETRYT